MIQHFALEVEWRLVLGEPWCLQCGERCAECQCEFGCLACGEVMMACRVCSSCGRRECDYCFDCCRGGEWDDDDFEDWGDEDFYEMDESEDEMTETLQIRPLGDRLVVKPDPKQEMTESGIYLPDQAQEKPLVGTVKATGPGLVATELKTGDRVLFGKYSGTEVKLDGESYLIVRENEVLGVYV